MPTYTFLLYGAENDLTPQEMEAAMARHNEFSRAVETSGARIVSGEALQPSATATTIRNRTDADAVVTDGPFAETKEQVGGFYVIEAADLDQALALAKQAPEPIIEVRPVYPTS